MAAQLFGGGAAFFCREGGEVASGAKIFSLKSRFLSDFRIQSVSDSRSPRMRGSVISKKCCIRGV